MTLACRSVAEPVTYVSAPVLSILHYGKGKREKTRRLAKAVAATSQRVKSQGQPWPKVLLPHLPPPHGASAAVGACAMVHPSHALLAGSDGE